MLLHIKAKPGSPKSFHKLLEDGRWLIAVTAPAVDGKANEAICTYLAKILDLRKADVEVKSGHVAPFKTIAIDAVQDQVIARLRESQSGN